MRSIVVSSVVLLWACGEKTCPTGEELVSNVCVPIQCPVGQILEDGACVENEALGRSCPGKPFVDECAGVSPRIEVTVVDGAGNPLENVLVYPFDNTLNKSLLSSTTYPAKDGKNVQNNYDACTNSAGKATICGFDPTKLSFLHMYSVKSGYELGAEAPFTLGAAEVKQVSVTLNANPAATEEKILLYSPDAGHRDALFLVRNNLKFTFAPLTGGVASLTGDHADAPLRDFDTVIAGIDADKWTMWDDLLTNAEAFRTWISAGGFFFILQQNDSHWSKATGCSMSASACPVDVLPEAYRFDLIAEGAAPGGLNEFLSAHVITAHPTTDGVDFSGEWLFNEMRQPTSDKKFKIFEAINGNTVNKDLWTVHIAGPTDAAEQTAKTAACGACGTPDVAIAQMEAALDDGKIMISQAAWMQGSEGGITGGKTDANAVKMTANVVTYLKAHQK